MEKYFTYKFLIQFVLPAMFIAALILLFVISVIVSMIKRNIMNKLGYTYDSAAGFERAAYEFQPHWVKGNIKIHRKKIDQLRFWKVKEYVTQLEQEKKVS